MEHVVSEMKKERVKLDLRGLVQTEPYWYNVSVWGKVNIFIPYAQNLDISIFISLLIFCKQGVILEMWQDVCLKFLRDNDDNNA